MTPHIRAALLAHLAALFFLTATPCQAEVIEYTLAIATQEVDFTGAPARAMTINNSIPGPTLFFTEGDTARIHVKNTMPVETSIHWHGILVPPGMDGVPYISFPPIAAGATFTYEFPIRQSGTYWYHSHTSLQEQSGVYGSIVIKPLREQHHSDRDQVVLLSDWTDEDPHSVQRTLKRGSEWYSLEKGSSQSIIGAARLGMLGDYFSRELQRMPAMDIADVAYDRFLANGRPESTLEAKAGETVRLRIIDGSATTFFHLEYAGGPMQIIAADGLDVVPVKEQRFLIGVAETYDVLLKVPDHGAYEFRATAHDGSGHASVWIGAGMRHPAPDVPRPNLYHGMGHMSLEQVFALSPAGVMGMGDARIKAGMFDRPGMMAMGNMDGMQGMNHVMDKSDGHDGMAAMNHAASQPMAMKQTEHVAHPAPVSQPTNQRNPHDGTIFGANFRPLAADVSSSPNLARDGEEGVRPWPPYDKLRAIKPTAFPADKPVREIRLTLDGDMERYVWSLNNKTLSEEDTILIREGEVVRFIMINRTMMHHPMHLHGHFFRVINAQGDHAPLKHTVNVAPMSTTIIEFNANEVGDWFFHCHLLYHMKSGMARMVHYENFRVDPELAASRATLFKDSWYFWGMADVLNNKTEGMLTLSNTRNILNAWWEVGWENVEETEWEGLITWDRYLNRFFSLFAGLDLLGESNEMERSRGVLGFSYLLPLNIKSRTWVDWDKGARVTVDKEFELTPRLTLFAEAEYDTHTKWESEVGVSYMVRKHFAIIGQWHSDFAWGAGIRVLF